jgi:prepilin-type N-terminal cleavage/methylation domain-containing protein
MNTRRSRRGVTLLELLIALSITGFAILGGLMLLDQLNDSGTRIVADRTAGAKEGNGDRLFHRLLQDAYATADSEQRFVGDERNASYLTLCDTPSGWPERCRATITLDSLRDSSVVGVETSFDGPLVVRRLAGAATFRYLDLTPRDSSWAFRWMTSISLPGAIAIVTATDTAIFPLGSSRD